MTRASIKHRTAIAGVGMSRYQTRRDDLDLPGLQQEAAVLALEDAGLTMTDIEAIVLAQSPDVLHGIGQPEQVVVGPLAASGKPVIRVNTGGATGTSAAEVGWWAVGSGRFRCVLVIGAEKMGESTGGAQEALNKIWDPAYEAALPFNTIVMSAFHAVRHMKLFGTTEEQYAIITSRLRLNGTRNEKAHLRKAVTPDEVLAGPMLSWPLRRDMSCPRSSGACAVILVADELAQRLSGPRAWIRSLSSRANTYFMGEKMGNAGLNDHGVLYDLRLAAEESYEIAGIRSPSKEIDLAEPYSPFSVMEPAILEALQLCEPGEAGPLAENGVWDLDGQLPVSPSGGVVCANPISVTGLVRVAEAAQQIRGRAGDHQVDRHRTAVVSGVGGSYQFWAAGVLASEPDR